MAGGKLMAVRSVVKDITPNSVKRVLRRAKLNLKGMYKRVVKTYRHNRYHKALYTAFELINSNNRYNYVPIEISNFRTNSIRDWELRWSLIKKELQHYGASSVMDIGCAEGWFLRRAAEEMGCFALGIERDNNRVAPSEIARLYDQAGNIAVMKSDLNLNELVKLPQFDVILCLSVVHHIVRTDGIEAGRDFVKALSWKANKALIFEMGTSEEKEMEWAEDMPVMLEGQKVFLERFLKSAGLFNIREIGESLSFKKDAMRSLYVAEPGKSLMV